MSDQQGNFKVWASDQQIYGPISLQILLEWAAEGRINAQTWVFCCDTRKWYTAGKMKTISNVFKDPLDQPAQINEMVSPGQANDFICSEQLRLFDALVGIEKDDLETLINFCEVVTIRRGDFLCRKSEPADGMFLVISGQLKVVNTSMIGKQELLAQISEGQFVGELSIFLQGGRSADVVASTHTTLLKLCAANLSLIIDTQPKLAAHFLLAVGRTMSQRILAMNTQHIDNKKAEFLWR
ncbi:MAG: Crp/Fnr family transcriptional regulator [Limisphaerales bacterium]|nr:cyclic nucleotide-binding domain-containing protein [Verrucomicrobiae bacterium]